MRTRVFDMAAAVRPTNPVEWPEPYDSSGVAANSFTAQWHSREASLVANLALRCAQSGRACSFCLFFCLSTFVLKDEACFATRVSFGLVPHDLGKPDASMQKASSGAPRQASLPSPLRVPFPCRASFDACVIIILVFSRRTKYQYCEWHGVPPGHRPNLTRSPCSFTIPCRTGVCDRVVLDESRDSVTGHSKATAQLEDAERTRDLSVRPCLPQALSLRLRRMHLLVELGFLAALRTCICLCRCDP